MPLAIAEFGYLTACEFTGTDSRQSPFDAGMVGCAETAEPAGVGVAAKGNHGIGVHHARRQSLGQHDADQPRALARRDAMKLTASYADHAGEGGLHPAQATDQGGFARAVRPQQADEFPGLQCEVEARCDAAGGIAVLVADGECSG